MNFEHRCSMRCRWCYVPFIRSAPTYDVCLAVLRRLIAHGVSTITIGGGDPTSYVFWRNLVAEAKHAGLFVHLDTNGIGLRPDHETGAYLLSYVDLLGLPLDGPTSSVHQLVRGGHSHFELVLSRARWAGQLGVTTKINTIATKANVTSLHQMADIICLLRPRIWSIYEYWPLSEGGLERTEWQIANVDFEDAVAQLQGIYPTRVEINRRLARRLTYPIVAHDGSVYVHSADNVDAFAPVGSVFEDDVLPRAFSFCRGERHDAQRRYQ